MGVGIERSMRTLLDILKIECVGKSCRKSDAWYDIKDDGKIAYCLGAKIKGNVVLINMKDIFISS